MILLFYAVNAAAAIAELHERRAAKQSVRLLDAAACHEAEACEGIDFMPDVTEFDRARLTALFNLDAPAADEPKLTKREIIADLEAMSVAFDPKAKVADLLALRNEARAARDAAAAGEGDQQGEGAE